MSQLLVVFVLLANVATASEQMASVIAVNESLVLRIEAVDDVVFTNPEVVGFQYLESGSMVITGKLEGTTEVLVFANNNVVERHFIQVNALPDQRLKFELLALQRRFPQLQIEHHGRLVTLSGQVDHHYKNEIDELLIRYQQLASQVEFIGADEQPMVIIEVKIAEVKRSSSRHLGVRWPAHINGPLVENAGQWLHLPVSAQSTIDVMEREGHARLLASPTLTAISGGEADFLVGGEFPVPQVLAQGLQDVSFRPYGIQLKVAPQVLASGEIQAHLVAELSSIDPATAVNGIPGLLTRKVASTLVIPAGETLVLSGLIQHEQSQQADRFPGLHKLPIIGPLFASEQFRKAETDLVVLVTPRLAAATEQRRERSENAAQQLHRFRQRVGCVGLLEPFVSEALKND